jgi:hypothetical protein
MTPALRTIWDVSYTVIRAEGNQREHHTLVLGQHATAGTVQRTISQFELMRHAKGSAVEFGDISKVGEAIQFVQA